ncbi:hypothetical protein [Pseudonocardia sp. TRM90224]|uniref:hypothetical protein n=1 Tax=Pseudonocardia sp. TRM90224 TaxID=2812678 RepID=UPI001E619586|nr:hypothetical protein [Pseudonocardia sp. TRM90224]
MIRRARLALADVGGWLFTCNPDEFDPRAPVDARCARPSYRLGLVRTGQPVLLWVTGSAGATPEPGAWLAGRTTGEVAGDPVRPRIGLAVVELNPILPRERLRADPRTARMEVLRAPHGSNPFVISPAELAAITEMVGEWPQV